MCGVKVQKLGTKEEIKIFRDKVELILSEIFS